MGGIHHLMGHPVNITVTSSGFPIQSHLGRLAVAVCEDPAALHARLLAEAEAAELTVLARLQRDHAVLHLAACVHVAVPASEIM